jgi:hypothetical protein
MSKKTIYLDKTKLIEYKGDLYTPEELAEKLETSGDYEVKLVDDSWFAKAMSELEE